MTVLTEILGAPRLLRSGRTNAARIAYPTRPALPGKRNHYLGGPDNEMEGVSFCERRLSSPPPI